VDVDISVQHDFFLPVGKGSTMSPHPILAMRKFDSDGHKSQWDLSSDYILLPHLSQETAAFEANNNVGYFVSGWTWSTMTHRKRMQHASILKVAVLRFFFLICGLEQQQSFF
jgi:hypothetical protein